MVTIAPEAGTIPYDSFVIERILDPFLWQT